MVLNNASPDLSRFGLGSAQLGMGYGKFNRVGQPDLTEAELILRKAKKLGFSLIDTASQYGTSESVLGELGQAWEGISLITKTPSFNTEQITRSQAEQIKQSFDTSLARLHLSRVKGLLVHHAPDLLAPGGEFIYETLRQLKSEGLVEQIGVSVYGAEVADRILDKYSIDLIQVPINIFDKRLVESNALARWSRAGIEIHARSAFLQGLVLADPLHLPPQFLSIAPILGRFQADCVTRGVTPKSAALHYLLQLTPINKILIGIDSEHQLTEIFSDFPKYLEMEWDSYRIENVDILNPAHWNKS